MKRQRYIISEPVNSLMINKSLRKQQGMSQNSNSVFRYTILNKDGQSKPKHVHNRYVKFIGRLEWFTS